MAKKLNKKVAYTVIAVLGLGIIASTVVGFRWLRERNPQYCLDKARQLFKDGDFIQADGFYRKAYGHSNSDEKKIEILFEMSEFHLSATPDHEPKWRSALSCWNTVLNIDTLNIEARRKLLDYFYQAADAGNPSAWKSVDEHATKLMEVFEKTQQPLEPQVLTAKARACFELARQGSETNRDELVEKSLLLLDQLKKLTPDDPKVYRYITEATLLKGELDEAKGIQDARNTARKNAQAFLEKTLPNITDKGTIAAYLMDMELGQIQRDPNAIPVFRKKMEDLVATYPNSDLLYLTLSSCYELHTDMDRRQELDLCVRYTEKAQEIAGGQNVRYAIRNAILLRRIGQIYDDKTLVERSLKIAQSALEYPESIVIAGPKEGVARQNRYELQSFIARHYVEHAIAARRNKDEQAAKQFYDQAAKPVEEIVQLVGGSTTVIAQQWQGMLSLAAGNEKEGYRVLHKVYQELKTLDKPGEFSTVDSYLCYMLSRLAAAQGSLGKQREFLEKAISNRNNIAVEKPIAILDYANLMLSLRAGSYAGPVLDSYVRMFGENDDIRFMRIQANIQGGQFEDAEKHLNQIDPGDTRIIPMRLALVSSQLNRLVNKQVLAASSEPLTPEETNKLSQLQTQQTQLLYELVTKNPSQVDPQVFISICRGEIAQNRPEQAQKLLSAFGDAQPDNIGVQILKKELAEPDPRNITPSRRLELAESVLLQLQDTAQKSLMLAQHYRSLGKVEKAKEYYEKAYSQSPDSVEIAGNYFGFLLDQKNVKEAEVVFTKIRDKNPDGHDGNLYAAQLEMAKENYTAAFRRLDECTAIQPDSSAAAMVKSQIYLAQKNYEAAAESARAALQTDLQNGMAARLLAFALFERNRNLSGTATTEQVAELERSLGIAMYLNPNDEQLQSAYIEITQKQDPQRSLAARQALLKNTPNVSNALLLGGMAMRMAETENDTEKQKGLLDIAGDAYQKAYQMEPGNKQVCTPYAEYLRITKQQDKAVEIFAKDPDTLWRFYLSDAQYTQASEVLEKLLETKKDDVELLQGLADAYQGLGKRDKLKAVMDQAARLTLTAEQEIWLIQKYLDSGLQEQAQKRLVSFQERHPADERGQLLMAWLNMYQGNQEKALELIQRFLEKNPGSAPGWRVKGRIHRLMNQPQQAIDALQRSRSITPDPTIRIELSTIYKQTNQVEAAIGELVGGLDEPKIPPQMTQMLESLYTSHNMGNELIKFYQQMIKKYPNSPFWYSKTGTFLFEQKHYNDAVTMLAKAWEMTRKTPGEASALNSYLKALTEAQQLEKALSLATEYVDTPLAPVAYCNIAAIQAKQEQKEKAIDSFSKAIEKAAGKPAMLMGTLAVMSRILGSDYMETWCNQKLAADPKSIPAHIILGNIEEERGSYNKALEHIAVCLEQTSKDTPDWLEFSNQKSTLLLSAYVKTADAAYLKQAMEQLESILKLQPNNADVLNNLAYLMVDNNVQTDKAVEYSRRAFQASPENPVFLDTHAYALCRSGQFTEAERYLRQVIQMHEQDNTLPAWDVYKHFGMALEGQKKNKEALTAYEKSLELGKDVPEKEKMLLEKAIQNLKSKVETQ
jgi:tetratricopeptide (TPR) repeat protein